MNYSLSGTRPAVSYRSRAQIEALATDLLRQCAPEYLEKPMKVPICDILEFEIESKLGVRFDFVDLPYDVPAHTLPAGAPGGPAIQMRPDIWDRLSRDDPWARFTGAHEIGHGAMHIYEVAVDLPNGKLVGLRRSSSIPSGRDPERQADRFASYFLMPTQPFMLALESFGPNARALAEVFGTSLKATSIRLGDFGYR